MSDDENKLSTVRMAYVDRNKAMTHMERQHYKTVSIVIIIIFKTYAIH